MDHDLDQSELDHTAHLVSNNLTVPEWSLRGLSDPSPSSARVSLRYSLARREAPATVRPVLVMVDLVKNLFCTSESAMSGDVASCNSDLTSSA